MFTFKALPLHPAPYVLESFTGYLTRLAQENQITSVSGLSALVFPLLKRKANWTDYPRPSYGALPEATCCSVEQIQATTFYHLATKFKRQGHNSALAIFLAETIAPHWRGCALCLAEHGYTNLLWRFKEVAGCPEHGVALLEACTRCGATIPLVSTSLRVGICPSCHADLRIAPSIRLTDAEATRVKAVVDDLCFLLLPQPWETNREVLRGLGPYLAARRREHGWTSEEMAAKLQLTPDSMRGLDGQAAVGRGENFQSYKRYLELVGISFQEAFCQVVEGQPTAGQAMLRTVQQAAEHLIQAQKPVTMKALCDSVGKSACTLHRYPEVQAFLAQNVISRRTASDQQMLKRVKTVVERLWSDGQSVSSAEVAEQLGLEENSLRHYRETWAYLKQQTSAPTLLTEAETLTRVNQAIARLNHTGQRLSQAALCAETELSMHFLNYYSAVRQRLSELNLYSQDSSLALNEDSLLARVKEAVQQLRASGQAITQTSVAHHLGVAAGRFTGSPTVKLYIQNMVQEEAAQRRAQYEQTLLARLKRLIHELEQSGQPILRKTIAKHLEISLPTLRAFPLVEALLQASVTRYKTNRTALREQVEATVHTLRERGEPVTQRAVARLMGFSWQHLAHYPEIVEFLHTVTDASAHQQRTRQEREAQLLCQVMETIQQMTARGERVNQVTLAKAMNTSVQRLKFYDFVRPVVNQIARGRVN